VEAEVQALFPEVRTLRWDAETTQKKGAHDIILSHFSHHRADVLIGTQMLAKGLDLPFVTLVGVVLAEVGLNFPDYRASERTFQLLTQVAGRAGRSVLGGQVILQTYQPDQAAIRFAARHDFDGFYTYELEQRRKLGYPPFYRLIRLEYRHADAIQAERMAKDLARQLLGWIEAGEFTETEIVGPAPCFFGKLGGNYRWQVLVRGPNPAAVLVDAQGRLRDPLKDWRVEVEPQSVL
jgi:primosomal protein N' (replication factor Y)